LTSGLTLERPDSNRKDHSAEELASFCHGEKGGENMKKLGKNINPSKETVEAYCVCTSPSDWCYANCFGNSAAQSYANQYAYARNIYTPSAAGLS
jgi:putative bacteriocin precursor